MQSRGIFDMKNKDEKFDEDELEIEDLDDDE